MLLVTSSLAVIVGAVIAYQTVVVSVERRRRGFALLNLVGVPARTIVVLCLAETLVLAMMGVALGVVGGELLASVVLDLVGTATSEIWVQLGVLRLSSSTPGAIAAASVGIATALAAAWVAITSTFRGPPIEALRPVADPASMMTRPRLLGPAVGLIGATWLIAAMPPGFGFVPIVSAIVATQLLGHSGAAMLAAPLVWAAGNGTRHAIGSAGSLPVRLAIENLPRDPRRAGMTVASITAAIAMAASVAGLAQSFESAWLQWIEHRFGSDVVVGSGSRLRLLAGPAMTAEIGDRLTALKDRDTGKHLVAAMEPFRVVKIRLGTRPVFLQSVSPDVRKHHGGLLMVEGESNSALASLQQTDDAVLLSDNLAVRLGLHAGDSIALPTPAGPQPFRIVGTFVDYLGSLDMGSVVVAQETLSKLWNDRQTNLFRLWAEDGVTPGALRDAVRGELGDGYYAITTGEFLDAVREALKQFLRANWALTVLAVVIGVIGIVNAQLATVLDRSTEIATIRTIGVSTTDITRAVILECAALGTLGAVAGAALGGMLGVQFMAYSLPLVTGWRIPYVFPALMAVVGVGAAAVISAMAGYAPARLAARLTPRQISPD
jgi:putative ABC transport system permease protein